jgi:hypothetical protein
MNGKFVFRGLLALLLIGALVAGGVAIGFTAYRAGVAQGLVDSGKIVLPESGAAPQVAPGVMPYLYGYGYGPLGFHRPFGFGGFGFLGCLVPLLFLFIFFSIFFAIVRGIFWRMGRRGGWGHHGPWGDGPHGEGIPPQWRDRAKGVFDDWHQQAHGEQPKTEGKESQA